MIDNSLNKKKVFWAILILIGLAALFCFLQICFFAKSPCEQVGTTWRTSDDRIAFTVVDTDSAEDKYAAFLAGVVDDGNSNSKWVHGFGKAELSNNETVDIVFLDGIKGQVFISYAMQNNGEDMKVIRVHGHITCMSSNWCVVELWKSSELLGGKTFSFYKVGHGTGDGSGTGTGDGSVSQSDG